MRIEIACLGNPGHSAVACENGEVRYLGICTGNEAWLKGVIFAASFGEDVVVSSDYAYNAIVLGRGAAHWGLVEEARKALKGKALLLEKGSNEGLKKAAKQTAKRGGAVVVDTGLDSVLLSAYAIIHALDTGELEPLSYYPQLPFVDYEALRCFISKRTTSPG